VKLGVHFQQSSFKINLKKLLKPISDQLTQIEKEVSAKCTVEGVKKHATTLLKVEFDNLSEKLKNEIKSKETANDIVEDLVMKQKNLVVFGLQEDSNCTTKKSQNDVDLKLLNQVILQNCPVKCSFTVLLGRLNNGKCRSIKLFFHSPIERDAASFFLSGNLNTVKSSYPTFNFSHDCTKLELAQKKRYNALKEELNQKVTAGESG